MSIRLHKAERCAKCGHEIPAGERADRNGAGWSATYSHWNGFCPKGAPAVATAPRADLATERQVRYALALQDSASPFERRTAAQLAAMSRAEISRLIDVLLSNG